MYTYDVSDVYTYAFNDTDSFLEYQRNMKKNSTTSNEIQLIESTKFVSLSTCNGLEGTSKRIVIQGIEVSAE